MYHRHIFGRYCDELSLGIEVKTLIICYLLALILTGCLTEAGREIGLIKPKVCTILDHHINFDGPSWDTIDTVACDSTEPKPPAAK
jgi:hypothetical protein